VRPVHSGKRARPRPVAIEPVSIGMGFEIRAILTFLQPYGQSPALCYAYAPHLCY
jgi:hypothetical protein